MLQCTLFIIILISPLKFSSAFISSISRNCPSRISMDIAPFKLPRSQNVPGNIYVDESCIDCDVCRWMCPSTFSRKGVKSIVHTQPISDSEKILAYAAMVSCPVGSIRLRNPDELVKLALEAFPAEIDADNIPTICHLGFHSVASFGATPYFIKNNYKSEKVGEEVGNIIIDSPRFNCRLAKSIEEEGGVTHMILTHKDDVADHARWKERFPDLVRIIHRADVTASTQDCEILLEGTGEWFPTDKITIIHTPGHTAGSLSVLVRTPKDAVLFTGDHIAYSDRNKRLDGFKRYNQGNPIVQSDYMRRLSDSSEYPFTWILPAHGRMLRFESLEEKESAFLEAADMFDAEDEFDGILGVGYY